INLLRTRFVSGRRRLVGAGFGLESRTNDLGRFRLYGLQPGSYILSADAGRTLNANLAGYGRTYFPGVTNPADAQRVSVDVAQQLTGLIFAIQPVKTARVSGQLFNAAGEPWGGAVEMMPSDRSRAL